MGSVDILYIVYCTLHITQLIQIFNLSFMFGCLYLPSLLFIHYSSLFIPLTLSSFHFCLIASVSCALNLGAYQQPIRFRATNKTQREVCETTTNISRGYLLFFLDLEMPPSDTLFARNINLWIVNFNKFVIPKNIKKYEWKSVLFWYNQVPSVCMHLHLRFSCTLVILARSLSEDQNKNLGYYDL